MMKYWNSLLRLDISLCKGRHMAYSLDDIFIDSIFEAKDIYVVLCQDLVQIKMRGSTG